MLLVPRRDVKTGAGPPPPQCPCSTTERVASLALPIRVTPSSQRCTAKSLRDTYGTWEREESKQAEQAYQGRTKLSRQMELRKQQQIVQPAAHIKAPEGSGSCGRESITPLVLSPAYFEICSMELRGTTSQEPRLGLRQRRLLWSFLFSLPFQFQLPP